MLWLKMEINIARMPITAPKSPPNSSLAWVSSIGIDLLNLKKVSGIGVIPWKPVFIRSILVNFFWDEIASLYPCHLALFL